MDSLREMEEAKLITTNFNWSLLHPEMRQRAEYLAWDMIAAYNEQKTVTIFAPFEGYRSPERQRILYEKTPLVTKAVPWRSAHQYGLAVDFVAWTATGWSWDDNHDWNLLQRAAQENGLDCPISWDRAHVEHPAWVAINRAWRGATTHVTG